MNLWMENGTALNPMMPYLSKYLGHRSPDGTFYYYHQINSALKIVRDRDTLSSEIIPEVAVYEE
jgi:integrase